jgi:hypothetical protein
VFLAGNHDHYLVRRGAEELFELSWPPAWHRASSRVRSGASICYASARLVRPSDPSGPALDAFDKLVANLGWAHDTDKIVFAHTHPTTRSMGSPSRAGGSAMETASPDLPSRSAPGGR